MSEEKIDEENEEVSISLEEFIFGSGDVSFDGQDGEPGLNPQEE